MEQKRERIYATAPIEKNNALQQRLEKKDN